MATWAGQVPAMLAVLGLLIIPGLPVALCVRARGVIRLGVAIIVSVAVIAAASLIAPVIGLGWSLLPVLLVAVIVSLVAVALRRVGRGSGDRSIGTASKWVWGAVILAFCGWTTVVAFGVGGADHPNQLYDGLFHLNAVEFILQNSDASPLHMTMVAPETSIRVLPDSLARDRESGRTRLGQRRRSDECRFGRGGRSDLAGGSRFAHQRGVSCASECGGWRGSGLVRVQCLPARVLELGRAVSESSRYNAGAAAHRSRHRCLAPRARLERQVALGPGRARRRRSHGTRASIGSARRRRSRHPVPRHANMGRGPF